MSMRGVACGVAWLVLAAALSGPARAEGGQAYTCQDGTKFSIVFNAAPGAAAAGKTGPAAPPRSATLALVGGRTSRLTARRMGSGIDYGNRSFEFLQHQGAVTLVHRREGKETSRTACTAVK